MEISNASSLDLNFGVTLAIASISSLEERETVASRIGVEGVLLASSYYVGALHQGAERALDNAIELGDKKAIDALALAFPPILKITHLENALFKHGKELLQYLLEASFKRNEKNDGPILFQLFSLPVENLNRLELAEIFRKTGRSECYFFHLSARLGDLELVNYYFDYKLLNALQTISDMERVTPLHAAAEAGHLEVVTHLVSKGADSSKKSSFDRSLLHSAVLSGKLGLVRFCLDHHVALNGIYLDMTPLQYAVKKGYFAIALLLIEHGGDITAVTDNQLSLLHFAAMSGSVALIQFCLDHGLSRYHDCIRGILPLHHALMRGHLEGVKLLLTDDARNLGLSRNQETLLHFAAKSTNCEVVRCIANLYPQYKDMQNNEGKTPLMVFLHQCCYRLSLADWETIALLVTKTNMNLSDHTGANPFDLLMTRRGYKEDSQLSEYLELISRFTYLGGRPSNDLIQGKIVKALLEREVRLSFDSLTSLSSEGESENTTLPKLVMSFVYLNSDRLFQID